MKTLVDKLIENRTLTRDEFITLINSRNEEISEYIFENARRTSEKHFGKNVYIRGLIEFTNYCRNDCYYCGIRKSNANCERYRLSKEEILKCCKTGMIWALEPLFCKAEKMDSSMMICAIS